MIAVISLLATAVILGDAFRIKIFTDFLSHPTFANRTCVLSLEPFRDTLCVEAMQAWQYDVLLFDLVATLTDRTLLILFAEVRRISFRKLTFRQHLN